MSANKFELLLDLDKATLFLLEQFYKTEFVEIDNMNQHKDGYNFYEWLHEKEFITDEDYDIIVEALSKEN